MSALASAMRADAYDGHDPPTAALEALQMDLERYPHGERSPFSLTFSRIPVFTERPILTPDSARTDTRTHTRTGRFLALSTVRSRVFRPILADTSKTAGVSGASRVWTTPRTIRKAL